ncbi:hypothetical protein FRC10_011424 [Ceratobasidium sp. 414]|nr:hypothetical protein FRC10_011424 [Ceratobasidium sp. 414]
MARYRDKHPCIIFPSNITHTPPQLPAHVPIQLEPVTGPPSDKHIKSVQTALRLYESMANIPSMFDADLSMKLSQHLFDIQFERYFRQVADADRSAPVTTSRAEKMDSNHSDAATSYEITGGTSEGNNKREGHIPNTETATSRSTRGSTEEPHRFTPQPRTAARLTVEQIDDERSEPQPNPSELVKIGSEDTNQLLAKIGSTLEDMNRTMIGTQQSMAKAGRPVLVGK